MKRISAFLVATLLLLSIPIGISHAAQQTLTIFHGQTRPNEDKWMAIFDQFSAEHPEIKLEFVFPPCGEATDLLLTHMAAGEPVDVVFGNCIPGFATLALQDSFVDLSPFISRDQADISPQALVPGVLEPVQNQGSVYAITYSPNMPIGMVYNADLIDAAGLARPPALFVDDDWTWERMVDYARKLTRKRGDGTVQTFGVDPTGENLVHVWARGGDYFPPEVYRTSVASSVTLNSPENVAAYEGVASLWLELGVAPANRKLPDGRSSWVAMGQGDVAMMVGALGGYGWPQPGGAAPWNPGQKFGVTGYPGPAGQPLTRAPGFAQIVGISKNTRDSDAAWTFLKWILTGLQEYPELIQGVSRQSVRISNWQMAAETIHSAHPNEWALSPPELTGFILDALRVRRDVPINLTVGGAEVQSVMRESLRPLFDGEASAANVLAKAQEQATAILGDLLRQLEIQ